MARGRTDLIVPICGMIKGNFFLQTSSARALSSFVELCLFLSVRDLYKVDRRTPKIHFCFVLIFRAANKSRAPSEYFPGATPESFSMFGKDFAASLFEDPSVLCCKYGSCINTATYCELRIDFDLMSRPLL